MKRVLSVLLALCLLLGAVPMFASAEATVLDSGTCGDGITWTLDSDMTLTVTGQGKIQDYADPAQPNDVPNSILGAIDYSKVPGASGAYVAEGVIKRIVVSEGITDIGNNAFRARSKPYPEELTVSLPSTLKHIGSGAFYYSDGMKHIDLPDGLTRIGDHAFYGSHIEEITIPGSVKTVEEYAFGSCGLLKRATFEEGVKEIENWAFYIDSGLATVDIPHSMEIIGVKAFGMVSPAQNEAVTDINYNGTEESWKYIQSSILADEFPDCKTFMDDLPNATVHYQGGDIEPDPSTEPEGEQLYFYDGVTEYWDEELGANVITEAAGGGSYPEWGNALPIYENRYFLLMIEEEDGSLTAIPFKDLVASEGLILEEVPVERLAEDSKDYAGKIVHVATSEYDKVYTITYTDDAGTVYTATVDSHAYGPNWYSEPEMDNANIIGEALQYSSIDEQPSAFLGIKMDPRESNRRVASVSLDPDHQHSKDFTMEKLNDTFWKFTLKREAMTGFPRDLAVKIQWEHKDESGNWVPDEYPEWTYCGFYYFDDSEPMPEGEQLYVYQGVSEMGWNDELDAPIYGYDPGPDYETGMGILPGQQRTLFFAIKTGETSYQDIPVSELTVPAGVHLTAIPEEQLEEDSKNLAGCAAFMTVDDFDKGYTITYTDDNGELYALRLNSSTYGALFYTKPEFKNEYIDDDWHGYNVVGDQPVIYLGIKDEPLSHRRVKTVKMNDESLENYTFEKVNDSFWKITLKKESMGKFNEKSGSFSMRARVEIQWEHEEGEGNWVQDDWLDTPETGFWPEETLAYATTDLLEGKTPQGMVIFPLEEVRDKLSTKLDLTVGESKEIYPCAVQTRWNEDTQKEEWVALPHWNADVNILKPTGAVVLPAIDFSFKMNITAGKPGTDTLKFTGCDVSLIKDLTTGELVPDDQYEEYLNEKFGQYGVFGQDFGEPYNEIFVEDGVYYVPIVRLSDRKVLDKQPIKVARWTEGSWYENGITVTVKEKPQPKPPVTPSFTDVPAGQYYTDAVAWAVAEGITNGMTKNTFVPSGNCTRAQIVTFIWRALDKPATDKKSTFTDMPTKPADFVNAINWAVAEGVTKGKGKGTFLPDATCTRAEAVTFIWRALGKPQVTVTDKFTDMPSNSDFQKAISWAVANGVTKGKSSTTFDPNGTCTRGEIVTFLHRAMA